MFQFLLSKLSGPLVGQALRTLASSAMQAYEGWLARQEIRKNERLKNELATSRRAVSALKKKLSISVAIDPNDPNDGFDVVRDDTGKQKAKRVRRVRGRNT